MFIYGACVCVNIENTPIICDKGFIIGINICYAAPREARAPLRAVFSVFSCNKVRDNNHIDSNDATFFFINHHSDCEKYFNEGFCLATVDSRY
jgi:hypothetical protein